MIDLDRIERQLESATTSRRRRSVADPAPPAPPSPQPRPPAAVPASAGAPVGELVAQGRLADAERMVAGRGGEVEALSWAAMRALLRGDQGEARANSDELRELAAKAGDRETWERYWAQRFWIVVEWGDQAERDALAEHCRERAYRADDLRWWAALAVLLAQTGKAAEAAEAWDDAFGRLPAASPEVALDVATNLAEAAALLNDSFFAGRLHYSLAWTPGLLVTVGDGWVCKGAIERFRALGAAAVGNFDEADRDFRHAVATHRSLGAEPLLARTLRQWAATLHGRDNAQAGDCLREADELSRRLRLTGPVSSRR